jgi:hypothetical protein
MTGRSTALIAAAALFTAVLGIAFHPLLPRATTQPPPVEPATTPTIPASVVPIADLAANRALACPPKASGNAVDCGSFHIVRRQADCPTDARCEIELVGALHTPDAVVPVAITATLTDGDRGWRVVEVAS